MGTIDLGGVYTFIDVEIVTAKNKKIVAWYVVKGFGKVFFDVLVKENNYGFKYFFG